MRLEKCWFCSSTIYPGHGIQIFQFCRSKCHKNFKMKRNPRKVKWTKAYRRLNGKDMTQDSTFEFERKRNRPERYDRNLAENTLKAIKKIGKVRVRREAMHHEMRMKGKKQKEQREAAKELEQSIHLVKAPSAAGAEHPSGQSTFCYATGPVAHSSEDQSQSFSIASRECTDGRVMNVCCECIYASVLPSMSLAWMLLLVCVTGLQVCKS